MTGFSDAIKKAGIDPPSTLQADGTLHRFHVIGDRPRKENGWYVLHDDPPAGAFGCWKRGISESWSGREYQALRLDEKARYRANLEAAKRQREEEQARRQAECRRASAELWQKARDVDAAHPYLVAKGIKSFDLKQWKESLMIPVRGNDGTLRGLQFIRPDGGKKFKRGTEISGAYFSIGRPKGKTLLICEGYATGATLHEVTGHAVAIAFNAGNLKPAVEALRSKYPDWRLILCADDDCATEGNPGLTKAAQAARDVAALLAVPSFPVGRGAKDTDFNDLYRLVGAKTVKACVEAADIPNLCPESECPAQVKIDSLAGISETSRVRVIEAADFMALKFPPRENILDPWLPRQGLAMVYAPRGIGKTHFSLGVAYAVASGGTFFNWQAPVPRGVLFLDGEMPAGILQERLARIDENSERKPNAPLQIITPDLQPSGMIDLTRAEDQREVVPYLDGVDLIVVDNLSTLCRSGKENEGEGWLPVQEWALSQRAAGRSVLFIHHAGKNGEQRGTSRREDVLDVVIALKRPADYTPDKGACFEVHFEKARGNFGDDIKTFEAQLLTTPDGRQEWATKPLEESTAEKVAALLNNGIRQQEIAELLGITKGAVSKARRRAQEAGLLIVS